MSLLLLPLWQMLTSLCDRLSALLEWSPLHLILMISTSGLASSILTVLARIFLRYFSSSKMFLMRRSRLPLVSIISNRSSRSIFERKVLLMPEKLNYAVCLRSKVGLMLIKHCDSLPAALEFEKMLEASAFLNPKHRSDVYVVIKFCGTEA